MVNRRSFFTAMAGIVTGTAVAQDGKNVPGTSLQPSFEFPDPYVSATWYDHEEKVHIEVAPGAGIVWHQDGETYELKLHSFHDGEVKWNPDAKIFGLHKVK